MAKLPTYADKDLLATALLLAGMDPGQIQAAFSRSQDNPQGVVDSFEASNDDNTRKLIKLATDYVANPGTGHLTTLLKNAGLDESQINQAIANAQGPNPDQKAPTPSVGAVLASLKQIGGDPYGFVEKVNNGLTQVGAGQRGLTTTREQYLFGPPPPPVPPAPPAPSGPAPAAPPGAPGPFKPSATPSAASGIAPYRSELHPANVPAGGTGTAAAGAAAANTAAAGGLGNRNDKVTIDDPSKWDDAKIQTFIKQSLGANGWFVDVPEVYAVLKNLVVNGKSADSLEPALEKTNFWTQNAGPARSWIARLSDPGQAADVAADIAQQTEMVTTTANTLGIQLDPERARQISEQYLKYGWTATDLQRALGAEWHYDPSSKDQAAAVTKMKADAKDWLVPLSDQALQTWGAGLIAGTTTEAQFTQYLRDNAKSLMPQFADLIDQHAGDPNFTMNTYVDSYRQHAANILGVQASDVDFSDPANKWHKALDTTDSKTGQRRVMTLSEWDQTLKSDPTYGYDKTTNGVNDAMDLASSLKTALGF